jgi:hypothetical protein
MKELKKFMQIWYNIRMKLGSELAQYTVEALLSAETFSSSNSVRTKYGLSKTVRTNLEVDPQNLRYCATEDQSWYECVHVSMYE